MSEVKFCSARCDLFRCGKDSQTIQGNNIWCRWTEDQCEVSNCTYATCIKRRLLPKGICGETVKRKTVEVEPEKAIGPMVKLKGKALRRIGEKEIF